MPELLCLETTGPYPDLVDCFFGPLVIVGGGRCVWDDLDRMPPRVLEADVMCINDVVMHYSGKVMHFYSNDHDWTPKWLAARRRSLVKAFGPILYVHNCKRTTPEKYYRWPWPAHGTSALNAVFTGLAMGYAPIYLAGIPLDDSGHYFSAPRLKSNFTEDTHIKHWRRAIRNVFQDRVIVLSGRIHQAIIDDYEDKERNALTA